MRRVDERLYLNEKRPRALLRHQHGGAGNVGLVFGEEDGRRVRHASKAVIGHGEDAEFVDSPEAVLEGSNETEVGVLVALEVKHRVDDVLENAGARQRAVLRDVPDEDERRAHGLGHAVSLAAHSRTCETEPGALSSALEKMVWIESITTYSGLRLETTLSTCSSSISLISVSPRGSSCQALGSEGDLRGTFFA